MRSFLHVGCGPKYKGRTTAAFASQDWQEIRFDIDPKAKPDLVGTMTDMSAVQTGSVQAIFSSHNIEHLYPHEVPVALSEFHRVLSEDGFAVITCPDLKSVCALVAQDKLADAAYTVAAGGIAPIDILYGWRGPMAAGNLFMAHKCGFTLKTLLSSLGLAGFKSCAGMERGRAPYFDLWVVASKTERSEDEMKGLAQIHFTPV
jgi:hypothetical protein